MKKKQQQKIQSCPYNYTIYSVPKHGMQVKSRVENQIRFTIHSKPKTCKCMFQMCMTYRSLTKNIELKTSTKIPNILPSTEEQKQFQWRNYRILLVKKIATLSHLCCLKPTSIGALPDN